MDRTRWETRLVWNAVDRVWGLHRAFVKIDKCSEAPVPVSVNEVSLYKSDTLAGLQTSPFYHEALCRPILVRNSNGWNLNAGQLFPTTTVS